MYLGEANWIFSDLLWYESEDIKKKKKNKASRISFGSNNMSSMIALIDYCVYETFCGNSSLFILKWFEPNSFGEVVFLEKSYENMQKIQIVEILSVPSIQHQGVCP